MKIIYGKTIGKSKMEKASDGKPVMKKDCLLMIANN